MQISKSGAVTILAFILAMFLLRGFDRLFAKVALTFIAGVMTVVWFGEFQKWWSKRRRKK